MPKLLTLIRRAPSVTRAELRDHLLDAHGRFAAENPHVARCVLALGVDDDPTQSSLAQAGASEVETGYDACEILWFHDLDHLRRGLEHPAWEAGAAELAHAAELPRSATVVADEHVHIEPAPPSRVLFVECLVRTADIDRATFSDRWLHHAAIAHKANALGYLSGYVQNHALLERPGWLAGAPGIGGSSEDWDGVMTGYFQSIAVAKALFVAPLASEEAFEDERSFIDHSKASFMLGRRHVVKEAVR